MLELYVTLVKAEIRTIDSVPAAFREKVKAAIEAAKTGMIGREKKHDSASVL